MRLAEAPTDETGVTWHETLFAMVEMGQPGLFDLEWLIDRIDRTDRAEQSSATTA